MSRARADRGAGAGAPHQLGGGLARPAPTPPRPHAGRCRCRGGTDVPHGRRVRGQWLPLRGARGPVPAAGPPRRGSRGGRREARNEGAGGGASRGAPRVPGRPSGGQAASRGAPGRGVAVAVTWMPKARLSQSSLSVGIMFLEAATAVVERDWPALDTRREATRATPLREGGETGVRGGAARPEEQRTRAPGPKVRTDPPGKGPPCTAHREKRAARRHPRVDFSSEPPDCVTRRGGEVPSRRKAGTHPTFPARRTRCVARALDWEPAGAMRLPAKVCARRAPGRGHRGRARRELMLLVTRQRSRCTACDGAGVSQWTRGDNPTIDAIR